MTPDRWVLTFRAEGDGPPMGCRIKRLLKYALRTCRLRCIDLAAPIDDQKPQTTDSTPDDDEIRIF